MPRPISQPISTPPQSITPQLLFTAAGPGGEDEDSAAIERFRTANNFRRRADGRVLLWGRGSGGWMEAKLDGYVEGEGQKGGGAGEVRGLERKVQVRGN